MEEERIDIEQVNHISAPSVDGQRKRVAIVTGASRGIGRAVAIELARTGVSVVVNYRQQQAAAQQVVETCNAQGVSAISVKADVTDEQAVKQLFVAATALGTPSILVNNAGLADHGLLMDLSVQQWRHIIDTNLTSVFLCSREAIPYMRHWGSGRIVNISSIHGLYGASNEAAYAASKGAMNALTKSLAQELGSLQITVNAVAPGVIETEMLGMFSREEQLDMVDATPVGRLGQPEDVAALVRFLVSDAASFLTGQVISPNGGRMT
ncbi:elongation factor P 5-aminopentanone reductase [Alicyclobacillus fodiniaquatilis]|uniref:Elongation factor P 5-aminopentanone reductase n=1 Tax=Alicyclobacillus fodiniaquatilis TaxID=1661150 RepID=A0ABW4JP37_9BACL